MGRAGYPRNLDHALVHLFLWACKLSCHRPPYFPFVGDFEGDADSWSMVWQAVYHSNRAAAALKLGRHKVAAMDGCEHLKPGVSCR